MRIFVTGASGWIGSAVVRDLVDAGHEVVGLARSDESAGVITGLGAEVQRGDLDDLDSLRRGAAGSDGVVHLGYNHDFSDMQGAAQTDLAAITTMGEVIEGTDKLLLVASGVAGLRPGQLATEQDMPDPSTHPRIASAEATLALASSGVRSVVARFAPTVHGPGDKGFVATLVGVARERGVSGFIGDGAGRWPAVHRFDAATLVRRAVEDAPAGTVLHVIAEEGIPTRTIAEAIGRGLDLPVESIAPEDAPAHFGWIGMFFGADVPASNAATRERFAWDPVHPGLIDDLDAGSYFRGVEGVG
jgi:nucleoside-diphosphate-sugar epimerase